MHCNCKCIMQWMCNNKVLKQNPIHTITKLFLHYLQLPIFNYFLCWFPISVLAKYYTVKTIKVQLVKRSSLKETIKHCVMCSIPNCAESCIVSIHLKWNGAELVFMSFKRYAQMDVLLTLKDIWIIFLTTDRYIFTY